MTRGVRMVALAGVCLPLLAQPADAARRVIVSPPSFAVTDLGRDVRYRLARGCRARVVATFGDQRVSGPRARGCRGRVRVPSREQLTARGWADGGELELELVAGKARRQLRYKHLQPDLGEPLAGSPVVVPAEPDPQGDVNSLIMQAGDAVDLGRVDLTGVYALFIRAAGAMDLELRADSADGPVLAAGNAGHARPDWMLKPRGLGELYQSVTAPLGKHARGKVRLVLVATSGTGLVNYVDLTGSGAMAPHRYARPLPGSVPIFDGKSIDSWKQIGAGSFAVDPDRSLRAIAPESGWGWLYNPAHSYTNFVLRVRVKMEAFGANGGILVRHSDNEDNTYTSFTADEVQVTDVNTEYMGGIDHVATALRQGQSSPGEWSTVEVIANGPRLRAWVNGVLTADHDQSSGCNLPSVPCNGGAAGGYLTGGSGFIGFEAELLNVWYRDIRVHDCGVTDATTQTSTDPLCA